MLLLLSGEFFFGFGFAGNHAFIIQKAAQSFYYNNDRDKIFTVEIYYNEDVELKHISITIISDSLAYHTIAVHECQKIIVH